jgi:hypothetical protein
MFTLLAMQERYSHTRNTRESKCAIMRRRLPELCKYVVPSIIISNVAHIINLLDFTCGHFPLFSMCLFSHFPQLHVIILFTTRYCEIDHYRTDHLHSDFY